MYGLRQGLGWCQNEEEQQWFLNLLLQPHHSNWVTVSSEYAQAIHSSSPAKKAFHSIFEELFKLCMLMDPTPTHQKDFSHLKSQLYWGVYEHHDHPELFEPLLHQYMHSAWPSLENENAWWKMDWHTNWPIPPPLSEEKIKELKEVISMSGLERYLSTSCVFIEGHLFFEHPQIQKNIQYLIDLIPQLPPDDVPHLITHMTPTIWQKVMDGVFDFSQIQAISVQDPWLKIMKLIQHKDHLFEALRGDLGNKDIMETWLTHWINQHPQHLLRSIKGMGPKTVFERMTALMDPSDVAELKEQLFSKTLSSNDIIFEASEKTPTPSDALQKRRL